MQRFVKILRQSIKKFRSLGLRTKDHLHSYLYVEDIITVTWSVCHATNNYTGVSDLGKLYWILTLTDFTIIISFSFTQLSHNYNTLLRFVAAGTRQFPRIRCRGSVRSDLAVVR